MAFRDEVLAWLNSGQTEMTLDSTGHLSTEIDADQLHAIREHGKYLAPDPERAKWDRGFEEYAPAGATAAELDAIPLPGGTVELKADVVDHNWNSISAQDRTASMARHPAGKAGVLNQPLAPPVPITSARGFTR